MLPAAPAFTRGVFPMGHIRAAAGFCGACIAFYIGAGFATMQEIMQYEVSYGSRFTVVLAAAMLIYLYTNLSFATNGSRLKLQRGGEIYRHYCGKTLGASYGGFVILWFASFLAEIGGKNRLREVNAGILLSLVFIAGASAMCCVALISRVELTAYADIPALVLADAIHPLASQVFALIIFYGTYTASVPLLWTGVGRLAKEGTRRCRLLTVLGGVTACVSACFLPYKGLVNVLYGLNGYLGFLLVAFMVVKDLGCLFRGAKERAAGGGGI